MIFSKNSKIFGKTQDISAKTQFTGKYVPLWSHIMPDNDKPDNYLGKIFLTHAQSSSLDV